MAVLCRRKNSNGDVVTVFGCCGDCVYLFVVVVIGIRGCCRYEKYFNRACSGCASMV